MPMNYAKTALLLVFLTAILVTFGGLVGGQVGIVVAFAVALVMNLVSLWQSDKMVLRMFGAKEVDATSAPGYYNIVRELATRANLPMPRAYIIQSRQPNAFATGRNPQNAAVAVSTGLLETLDKEEIAGVVAHELAHIKNHDTLTMAVAATIGGAISMFAQYMQFSMIFGGGRGGNRGPIGWLGTIAAIVVAPMAAMMVQMAISRSREYQADRLGAQISGNPMALANALRKIENSARHIVNQRAEDVPAAAHMFIINPLTGQGLDNLFSTHPSTKNRVAELEAIAREMGYRGVPEKDHVEASIPKPTVSPRGPWSHGGRVEVFGSQKKRRRGPWG